MDLYRELNDENMCLPCAAKDHYLCWYPLIDKCCCFTESRRPIEDVQLPPVENKSILGGYQKSPEAITDVTSTGRKRAAIMYPITDGMICEWATLALAGGGVIPIRGCVNSPATAIHHGPDKNTLNNTPTNVHRICADCHNRWHAANDAYYGERPAGTEPFIPLDGWEWFGHNSITKADPQQMLSAAMGDWKSREARKISEHSTDSEILSGTAATSAT